MTTLRTGVIGAGMIAQIEHIPNLIRLRRRFSLAAVCDPSPSTRAFVAETFGVPAVATVEELLANRLDAVVVASPDALHLDHVLAAFAAGLHVFCEKPLCYGAADIDRLIAARDRAGKVGQVGYMKRFDPSYEAALRLLPGDAGPAPLRLGRGQRSRTPGRSCATTPIGSAGDVDPALVERARRHAARAGGAGGRGAARR